MLRHRYNWRPDHPDFRDKLFSVPVAKVSSVPKSMDLRPDMPPVVDQGQEGSCTGNAGAGLRDYMLLQKGIVHASSRQFIYYNERSLEGTIREDAGARVRDCMRVLRKIGACAESKWPYLSSNMTKKPTPSCFTDAAKFKISKYERVDNTSINDMLVALADRRPIIGGFTVYDSFESATVARTGVVPMPKKSEQPLGGHCILVVGYSTADERFIVRNSWGLNWGQKGYFTIPFDYFTNDNLATDFWTATA